MKKNTANIFEEIHETPPSIIAELFSISTNSANRMKAQVLHANRIFPAFHPKHESLTHANDYIKKMKKLIAQISIIFTIDEKECLEKITELIQNLEEQR